MGSSEEQEEFLQHGRFGEGLSEPDPNRGSRLRPAGLLLIIAAAAVFFSPRFRLARGILVVAAILGIGAVVTALLTAFESTGIWALVTAAGLLLMAVVSILFGPAVGAGAFEGAGYVIGFFYFPSCLTSFVLGGVVIIVGVVVDQ